MDKDAEFARMTPAVVCVEKGKEYRWCGCGESKTQPLCDKNNCGSKSVSFLADLTEDVYFCNCKQTKNPPWCDGSHAEVLLAFLNKAQEK